MTNVWPINHGFLLEGFAATYESATSTFKADAGRPIKRSISTRAYEMLQGNINLTDAEYVTFWTFWRVTLHRGILTFNFPHPVLNTLVEVEMAGDDVPVVNRIETKWQVNLTLRVLTET